MDAQEDARLRLAASRHPAARAVGTLNLAQRQLDDTARAFVTVMAEAGDPGAEPVPPPQGRSRWPRGHAARQARGWALPVGVDDTFACWLDTTGRWWLVRTDADGAVLDAHTVGSPLRQASELPRFRDGLEAVLAATGVPR